MSQSMSTQFRNSLRAAFLLTSFGLIGASVIYPSVASAVDDATRESHDEGDAGANSHDLIQGSHVEGHIAFLKAEIGITQGAGIFVGSSRRCNARG